MFDSCIVWSSSCSSTLTFTWDFPCGLFWESWRWRRSIKTKNPRIRLLSPDIPAICLHLSHLFDLLFRFSASHPSFLWCCSAITHWARSRASWVRLASASRCSCWCALFSRSVARYAANCVGWDVELWNVIDACSYPFWNPVSHIDMPLQDESDDMANRITACRLSTLEISERNAILFRWTTRRGAWEWNLCLDKEWKVSHSPELWIDLPVLHILTSSSSG